MTPSPTPTFAAVVVAAGKGLRVGGEVPKQFVAWQGKPLVRHSVEALLSAGASPVAVAIPPAAGDLAMRCLEGLDVLLVEGGETRQESVRRGLERLAEHAPRNVLIHDAARPAVPDAVIERLTEALEADVAAIPVLPVVDSLLRDDGTIVSRDGLHRVQTPQAFRFGAILDAHRGWHGAANAGDDAEVARAAGIDVALVEGDEALRKVTFVADLAEPRTASWRTGFGYDVHRLAEGEELWLCGVRIAHSKGLAGHSDADVALHALTDAVLGAAALGDIGEHFPPSDPQWRGASSDRFLRHAVALASEADFALEHVDVTIVCEAPRVGPHKLAMRARLADILGIPATNVSVKATTTERLGFTGREEGIAAQAVATLVRIA